MPLAEAHPSAEDLAAFTLGTLGDDAQAAITAHVAACTFCQESAAVAPGDTLIELLRSVHVRRICQAAVPTLPEAAPADAVTTAPTTADDAWVPGAAAVGQAVPDVAAGAAAPGPSLVNAALAAPERGWTLAPEPMPLTPVPSPLGSATAAPERGFAQEAVPDVLARHERYRVVRQLGRGGMGTVYEAEHLVMRRPVALKVINRAYTANEAAVERFRREVCAAAKLHHPNIVTAFDAEQAGDTHFLVMEYVAGRSLARLLKERGPLPVQEACDYVRQAALGLQHAHERGMVHRDVKPDNLMLTPDRTVKVLDFGLAALTAERDACSLTESNVIMGTPDYMAPEQAEDVRKADSRADVYSLGCTLYHLLTGRIPYPADTSLLKILAHRDRPVPSIRAVRPEVPKELEVVLRRLLAKKPEDRYQAPGEVATALAPFVQPASVPPPKRRRRLVAALVALLLVGVAVAGAVVYHIVTDTGDLVITTESDDVEVVIKQGGKEVRLIDTKTDKQIKLTLRSGVYELELKGAPEGLKLSIDKATLTRGETVLAKIERERPPVTRPVGSEIQVLHRVAIQSGGWRMTAVARDGKLFAAAVGVTGRSWVWDGETGKELFQPAEGAGLVAFSPDGRRFVHGTWDLRVYDTATWKKLLEIPVHEQIWSIDILPNSRHVLFSAAGRELRLADLTSGKVLQSWPPSNFTSTADGRVLFVKPTGEKSYRVWDVEKNQPSDEFARLARYDLVYSFLPGNKQAVVSDEGKLSIVDVATGKRVAHLPDLDRFTLSSRQLLGGRYADGKLRLFDPLTGKERAAFQLPEGERAPPGPTIALSPDARYASVVTDRSVYLLRLPDPPTGKDKP
jgi:WD40 repeat protein